MNSTANYENVLREMVSLDERVMRLTADAETDHGASRADNHVEDVSQRREARVEVSTQELPTTPALSSNDARPSDPIDEDLGTQDLEQVTLNYFSQPYYQGTVLRHSCRKTPHGQGTHISLQGDQYTGSFVHGLRHGFGEIIYANGDTYSGSWISGLHDGQGTYTESATGNTYTGSWSGGKRTGTGVTHWKVSDEDKRLCKICYEEEIDAAFYDCGHVVACRVCAARVEDCPVCRRRVRDVVRLFYGN